MINEIVHLIVKDDLGKQFEIDFEMAKSIVAKIKGFISLKLYKKLEEEGSYLLIIAWETVNNHKVGFRSSLEYQEWKNLLYKYYDHVPEVEYFEEIIQQVPIW